MLARIWLLRVTFLSFIASGPTFGGAVTIENPKSLPVNVGQVNVLYTMTCQEVAEAYHIPNYQDLEVPLTLVLGEDDERYVVDHLTGAGTVYLRHWTEQNFVAAAVMIAFHRVLSADRFNLEVARILTRFERIKPQSVTTLRRASLAPGSSSKRRMQR
jgi:hypothetical protein